MSIESCNFLIVLALFAGTAAAESPLAQRVVAQEGWVAYGVPMIANAGSPCCLNWRDNRVVEGVCDLDDRNWGTNDDHKHPRDERLNIYLHVGHAQVDRLRAFAESCKVNNAQTIRWLDGVAATDSVALLADWTRAAPGKSDHEHDDLGVAALAYHAEPGATRTLSNLAGSDQPRKLRESALFWLGQTRGAEGADIVERVATGDGDAKVREHAVFVLSQANAGDGYLRIRKIAQSDSSDHVRGQALFWMAQMDDARAGDDIIAAIGKERSDKVREEGVFALSQLKNERADAALIGLVRGDYPRVVKERALFWLGQSGSTQALQFIDDVLSKAPGKRPNG
jgi:HEAT repeats